MPTIEEQLRAALLSSSADTREDRMTIYEKAYDAANKIQSDRRQKAISALSDAIKAIEFEHEQKFNPDNTVSLDRSLKKKQHRFSDLQRGTFKNSNMFNGIGIAVLCSCVLAFMAVLFLADQGQDKPSISSNAENSTNTAELTRLIASAKFPDDYGAFIEQRPKEESSGPSQKLSNVSSKISFDVGLISKKFYEHKAKADYLVSLAIKVSPDDIR